MHPREAERQLLDEAHRPVDFIHLSPPRQGPFPARAVDAVGGFHPEIERHQRCAVTIRDQQRRLQEVAEVVLVVEHDPVSLALVMRVMERRPVVDHQRPVAASRLCGDHGVRAQRFGHLDQVGALVGVETVGAQCGRHTRVAEWQHAQACGDASGCAQMLLHQFAITLL